MVAKRVICCLTFKDGILFRSKGFKQDLRYTMSQVDVTLADELCLIDVGEDREAFFGAVDRLLAECFVPVTMGGRVYGMADAQELILRRGADKVIVGRAIWESPDEVSRMARKFGAQALVAAVDDDNGRARHSGLPTVEAAVRAQEVGCGEILFQSVQRDGTLNGYDLKTLAAISEAVTIPVIVCSGCGAWSHMAQGFAAGADACASNNIFHYTAAALTKAKVYLKERNVPVRLIA